MSDWKLEGVGRGMVEDTILIVHGKSKDNPQNNVKLHRNFAFIIDFYVNKHNYYLYSRCHSFLLSLQKHGN
jgi:hypothetical protein